MDDDLPRTGGKGTRRQIVGLDLLRAAAACLVLCFHLGFWIWREQVPHRPVPRAYAPFAPLFAKGWVGVEIFFVLSGFVIAYSTEGATARRFLQHRINRLVPAALVCATLTGMVLLTAYPMRAVGLLWAKSLIFCPVGPWIDGSYWTLPIEIAFYVLVFLSLLVRKGRYLPATMGVLGVLSTMCCLLVLRSPAWAPRGLMVFLGSAGFPPGACSLAIHGTFFALGVFLFLVLLHGATLARLLLLLVCGIGCVAELMWHDNGSAFAAGIRPDFRLPVVLWAAAVLCLVASVVWNGVFQERLGERGVRLTRRVGVATYPVYLLHDKIGQVLIGFLHRKTGYGPALVIAAVSVAGLAIAVAEIAEPPLRRGLQQVWRGLERGSEARSASEAVR